MKNEWTRYYSIGSGYVFYRIVHGDFFVALSLSFQVKKASDSGEFASGEKAYFSVPSVVMKRGIWNGVYKKEEEVFYFFCLIFILFYNVREWMTATDNFRGVSSSGFFIHTLKKPLVNADFQTDRRWEENCDNHWERNLWGG